jgi:hypothetical protein
VTQQESIHFETYEDFVKYSFVLDDKMEGQAGDCEPASGHFVALTDSQIYKLRIMLGHVLGDKDCAELNEQLDCLYDNDIECEDYDKMFFTFMQGDERVVLEDGEEEATIQFK